MSDMAQGKPLPTIDFTGKFVEHFGPIDVRRFTEGLMYLLAQDGWQLDGRLHVDGLFGTFEGRITSDEHIGRRISIFEMAQDLEGHLKFCEMLQESKVNFSLRGIANT
jgi:hypothetical protein